MGVVWGRVVPCLGASAFSAGNFVKRLPIVRVECARIRSECAAAAAAAAAASKPLRASLSKFEALDTQQRERVLLYVDALLQWNQRMNLTAVREAGEVMERHVEDSLAIVPALCSSYSSFCDGSVGNLRLVDVGSGAGLPGIVLAIARPDWQVTLLESMKKRCTFLEQAVRITELTNVEVVRGRAEDLGRSLQFRECFDVAVARAVAEMRVLAEYCLPLVRVGGLFVAAKGHDPQDEVKNAERAIRLMGGSVMKVSTVESLSPYGQRTAIICLKERPTPGRYPRDPGTPLKEPL
ncbi:hypothetical protein MLD38_031960 [Melastoma candidum]|uniref:Uncharacterized protein n=1 Tax=Melastoma candidum TaxID=119954 RepID=A0ACB9MSM7_9MYRT|nr:hypothetical protein MLD38_031960 [Melastoma candidum]